MVLYCSQALSWFRLIYQVFSATHQLIGVYYLRISGCHGLIDVYQGELDDALSLSICITFLRY